jgi:hypothetical protein
MRLKTAQAARSELSKEYWRFKTWFVGVLVSVTLWVGTGWLFYARYAEFTTAQAFYYTVQAGLSVGFGATNVTCAAAPYPDNCLWCVRLC